MRIESKQPQRGDRTSLGRVTLASHTLPEAEAEMAELKQAVADCEGFAALSTPSYEDRWFTVKAGRQVRAGDDSATFVRATPQEPIDRGFPVTVVRSAGVIATSYGTVPAPSRPGSTRSRGHRGRGLTPSAAARGRYGFGRTQPARFRSIWFPGPMQGTRVYVCWA
ncbi:hypothetical protein ACWDYJ_28490 [Streptomyces sp. NPDC003042]